MPATYRYRLAGTRLCEMFGLELRGRNLLDGWSEADRRALARPLGLDLRAGRRRRSSNSRAGATARGASRARGHPAAARACREQHQARDRRHERRPPRRIGSATSACAAASHRHELIWPEAARTPSSSALGAAGAVPAAAARPDAHRQGRAAQLSRPRRRPRRQRLKSRAPIAARARSSPRLAWQRLLPNRSQMGHALGFIKTLRA